MAPTPTADHAQTERGPGTADSADNGAVWTQAQGTIDGCPNHLAVVAGQKMVSYDVAAWADLWFYSNPIYLEVSGASLVKGIPASATVVAKRK